MELTEQQQIEYDVLHKAFVAQGGPTKGQLKAAGIKDPDGVARLVALGWVNPDAVEDDGRTEQVEGDLELAKAEKEAEEAKEAADKAIKKAEKAAKVALSKQPAPCSRCGGDGKWHSLKTGYRAKTSATVLFDHDQPCPDCLG